MDCSYGAGGEVRGSLPVIKRGAVKEEAHRVWVACQGSADREVLKSAEQYNKL